MIALILMIDQHLTLNFNQLIKFLIICLNHHLTNTNLKIIYKI